MGGLISKPSYVPQRYESELIETVDDEATRLLFSAFSSIKITLHELRHEETITVTSINLCM